MEYQRCQNEINKKEKKVFISLCHIYFIMSHLFHNATFHAQVIA